MEHTLLKASCILEVKNKNKIFEKKRKKFLTNPIDEDHSFFHLFKQFRFYIDERVEYFSKKLIN